MNKKRTFLLLVIFCGFLSVIGCNPSESVVQTAIALTHEFDSQIQTAIAKTRAYDEIVGGIVPNTPPSEEKMLTNTITSSPTSEPVPTEIPTAKPNLIRLNQPVFLENYCEFRITDIKFARKILPPNTSGYYQYYEAKSNDSTLLDVVISIKNLNSIIKSSQDFITVSALFDNEYIYNSFAVLVGTDGSFNMGFYGIEPLLTGEVHHIIHVPNQVETSSKSLVIIFRAADQEYHYKYR